MTDHAGQKPASQTPAEIVAQALADYGDPYPDQRAGGILLVLKGHGYTFVRHYQSTDPDGKQLRYCATCFEDWPCSSSPAEEWVSARPMPSEVSPGVSPTLAGQAAEKLVSPHCDWCGVALVEKDGRWVSYRHDPRCQARDGHPDGEGSTAHEPAGQSPWSAKEPDVTFVDEEATYGHQ